MHKAELQLHLREHWEKKWQKETISLVQSLQVASSTILSHSSIWLHEFKGVLAAYTWSVSRDSRSL